MNLPGTLCENNIGKKLETDYELTPDNVRCLRPKYNYIGACWYQRKITIPKEWENKKVFLFLERIILKSEVWIDDNYIGNTSSLVSGHTYDLTDFVKANCEHTLTVLIDNRDTFYLSTYGHSYTNESQTIWNGIVGDISIFCEEKIHLDDIIIITYEDNKEALVKGVIKNDTGNNVRTKISFSIDDTDNKENIANSVLDIDVLEKSVNFEHIIKIEKDVINWNEFTPKTYKLTTNVNYGENNKKVICFGFRTVKTKDRDILLNNKKIYLRGNLECCVHPLTGYPPCDEDYWINIFKTIKDYGMNHIRFHSNCPPEAAFFAADKVGVYLQPEGPVWLDNWFMELGSHKEHYEFMPLEARRIITKYSNHPSFVIFCNGNEFRGDFSLLHNIIEDVRKIRPDIIYTLTANYDRPLDNEDDVFIAVEADKKGMRGNRFYPKMAQTIMTDYSEAVKSRNIPLIAHESGQYSVYPNIKEIPEYNGNLVPINFMAIEKDLEKKNMLPMIDKFVKSSGDFSARLYKEEIESYLRTVGYAGFQLLGIHDFPGQCTATIGLLDSFWKSKNIITPKWFKSFCNDIVLLMKTEKRIYNSDELFSAELMVAQFANSDISDIKIIYSLIDENNVTVTEGFFDNLTICSGTQDVIGEIKEISLSKFKNPTKMTFSVKIENSEYANAWEIWVFPNIENEIIEKKIKEHDIKIFYKWSEEVEKMLKNGEKVLLIPERESFINRPTYDGDFYPVFWSPVFFNKKTPCGMYINESDAFNYFATEKYSNYQWYNLLKDSYNFDVDNLPLDFKPIIEVIPNYYYNHRMTNLIEAKVLNGTLIVCSIDLDKLNDFNEAKWLKYSIIEHLNSVDANSLSNITLEAAKNIFISDILIEDEKQNNSSENFIN